MKAIFIHFCFHTFLTQDLEKCVLCSPRRAYSRVADCN